MVTEPETPQRLRPTKMHDVTCVALLPFAVVGSCLTFAWLTCQMMARNFPCRFIKVVDKLLIFLTLFVVAMGSWHVLQRALSSDALHPALQATVLVFAVIGATWLTRRATLTRHYVEQMRVDSQSVSLATPEERRDEWGPVARCWGNQISDLEVNQKRLEVPNLPALLEGLTITHLSDLHIQTRMPRIFFHRIAAQVSQLNSDIAVISGDFIDNCRLPPWFESELGQLHTNGPLAYVFGNHDKLALPVLKRALEPLDWAYCAGQPVEFQCHETRVRLFGDQNPWLSGNLDHRVADDTFDIAVCHSPDSWQQAIRLGFPLTLAGHTHGGQVRLPGLGPIVAPSRHGTYYACGVFEEDGHLMHVSRGVFGTYPLRFRCRPEITQLVLGATGATGTQRR